MIHQIVTSVSLESFRERSSGKKVVLIYPWNNSRNLFLSYFLSDPKSGLLYYRIPDEQMSLADLLLSMIQEFDSVVGGFGSNVRQALTQEVRAAQLGEAFAADLAAYTTERVILYLDELDRVALNSVFNEFCFALVDNLPANAQLAVSSRLLTYETWYNMVARGEAVVLGTEHRKNDVMFTVEETPKPQLEVYSLGRGYALVNGEQITNWDGALPRNLFFYFMDNPLVTRDEIFSTFWPDLSIKEATNVFHVTKRKITERITMKVKEPGNYELTLYTSGFYMPSNKIVRHYDTSDFQEAVERGMITPSEREEENLYHRAIDLYKAPFLQTVNMKWVDERRKQLQQLYAQALIGMGRITQKRQNYHQALGYYIRALKETPEREDLHRDVMLMYINLGMMDDARLQYHRLEKMLKESLDISPSKETREVFNLIKQ